MAEAEPARVEVVRSGGFAGLITKTELQLDQLEPAPRRELDTLLGQLGLHLGPPPPVVGDKRPKRRAGATGAVPGRGVDRFEYEVTLFQGRQTQRVTVSEVGLDEAVRQALDGLLSQGSAGQ